MVRWSDAIVAKENIYTLCRTTKTLSATMKEERRKSEKYDDDNAGTGSQSHTYGAHFAPAAESKASNLKVAGSLMGCEHCGN